MASDPHVRDPHVTYYHIIYEIGERKNGGLGTIFVENEVFRLDVPVDNALVVEVLESEENASHEELYKKYKGLKEGGINLSGTR